MKIMAFILFLCFYSGIQASAESTSCTENVLEVYLFSFPNVSDDFSLPEEAKSCLSTNAEFKNVLNTMCDSEGKLTQEYVAFKKFALAYRDQKRKVDAIEADTSSTLHDRQMARLDLASIDTRWIAIGNKFELYPPVSTVFDLVNNDCRVEPID